MIFEGDNWKTDKAVKQQPSRVQMQNRIDTDYATGKLSIIEWRKGTDHLSRCDHDGDPMIPPAVRRA